jgi:hypothetical protein
MQRKGRANTAMRTWKNVLSDEHIGDVVALFAA